MSTLFTITDQAVKHIMQSGKDPKILRISVDSGGCSGFKYVFQFESRIGKDDLSFSKEGVTIIIDPTSFSFLKDSQLDYKQELIGSYFVITNPNAQQSCGCGTSFTI